jgi:hypothetical protein
VSDGGEREGGKVSRDELRGRSSNRDRDRDRDRGGGGRGGEDGEGGGGRGGRGRRGRRRLVAEAAEGRKDLVFFLFNKVRDESRDRRPLHDRRGRGRETRTPCGLGHLGRLGHLGTLALVGPGHSLLLLLLLLRDHHSIPCCSSCDGETR